MDRSGPVTAGAGLIGCPLLLTPLPLTNYLPLTHQERLADGEFLCCRPTYVGRMILLCGRKDALFPFQCLVGPDWPCMLVTYSIVTVPTVFFFVLVYVCTALIDV